MRILCLLFERCQVTCPVSKLSDVVVVVVVFICCWKYFVVISFDDLIVK